MTQIVVVAVLVLIAAALLYLIVAALRAKDHTDRRYDQ